MGNFTSETSEQIRYYVYRLEDPRTGETFYIGKGKGNRVFSHAKGVTPDEQDLLPARLEIIKQIHQDGLEVRHIVHRHGMSEENALEVEAALIDFVPALRNLVKGHGSNEFGPVDADELQHRYQAEVAEWQHRMLLVAVNRSADAAFADWGTGKTYEAARFAWRIAKANCNGNYVLAIRNRIIVDAFVPTQWLPATAEHFPDRTDSVESDRYAFHGEIADQTIRDLYVGRRLPDDCRMSQSGICYVG